MDKEVIYLALVIAFIVFFGGAAYGWFDRESAIENSCIYSKVVIINGHEFKCELIK